MDPKSDKMEGLAVPTALQDSLVAHSGSLATASVLFALAGPLQVCFQCTLQGDSQHPFSLGGPSLVSKLSPGTVQALMLKTSLSEGEFIRVAYI